MCTVFKLSYYLSHCSDFNQIMHNDKDLQILFECHPKMRSTNPRWQTATILKTRGLAVARIARDDGSSSTNLSPGVTQLRGTHLSVAHFMHVCKFCYAFYMSAVYVRCGAVLGPYNKRYHYNFSIIIIIITQFLTRHMSVKV